MSGPPLVLPTAGGQDLDSADKRYDAHLRLEDGLIFADVFDSSVKEANRAHVESESADNDVGGAEEITEFLNGYGIMVTVKPRTG